MYTVMIALTNFSATESDRGIIETTIATACRNRCHNLYEARATVLSINTCNLRESPPQLWSIHDLYEVRETCMKGGDLCNWAAWPAIIGRDNSSGGRVCMCLRTENQHKWQASSSSSIHFTRLSHWCMHHVKYALAPYFGQNSQSS